MRELVFSKILAFLSNRDQLVDQQYNYEYVILKLSSLDESYGIGIYPDSDLRILMICHVKL